jgi:hypothetical protein
MNCHTDWCARNHTCGLGEHRATPIVLDAPGAGRVVLTRVRGTDGRDHAEVRLTIALPSNETHARYRLAAVLSHLETLIGPARRDAPGRRAA